MFLTSDGREECQSPFPFQHTVSKGRQRRSWAFTPSLSKAVASIDWECGCEKEGSVFTFKGVAKPPEKEGTRQTPAPRDEIWWSGFCSSLHTRLNLLIHFIHHHHHHHIATLLFAPFHFLFYSTVNRDTSSTTIKNISNMQSYGAPAPPMGGRACYNCTYFSPSPCEYTNVSFVVARTCIAASSWAHTSVSVAIAFPCIATLP